MSYRIRAMLEIEFNSDESLSITTHHKLEKLLEEHNIQINSIYLTNAADGLKIHYHNWKYDYFFHGKNLNNK